MKKKKKMKWPKESVEAETGIGTQVQEMTAQNSICEPPWMAGAARAESTKAFRSPQILAEHSIWFYSPVLV